jgi:hypothetical protein
MTLVGSTSGGITPAYFGINPYEAGAFAHRSFGGTVPPQPDAFKVAPGNYYGYICNVSYWQANDNSTYDSQVNIDINNGESTYPSQVVPDGYGWTTVAADTVRVNSSVIQNNEDNNVTVKKMYGVFGADSDKTPISSPNTVTDMPVMAMYLELENDDASDVNYFLEECGRHPSAGTTAYDWSPMDENESASAWIGKQMLTKNHNRIVKENRVGWTIPFYSTYTRSI